MPRINGFDVVNEIGLQHLPPTVFVTAYHEHAVQAFEIHAVDYVTKPVEPERLQTALERVREKSAARAALLTQSQLTAALKGLQKTTDAIQEYPEHLLVRDGEKEILLAVERIDWVEASEYYCCLHVGNRGYMLREAISDLNKRLNPRKFLRIHRSSIVRLDQIREIFREGQSDGSVVLLNGQTLRMSRSGRQRLSEYSGA
jgi:two-component system LytT family response regulator